MIQPQLGKEGKEGRQGRKEGSIIIIISYRYCKQFMGRTARDDDDDVILISRADTVPYIQVRYGVFRLL